MLRKIELASTTTAFVGIFCDKFTRLELGETNLVEVVLLTGCDYQIFMPGELSFGFGVNGQRDGFNDQTFN